MTFTRREILQGLLGTSAGAVACRRRPAAEWDGADRPDGRSWGHALRDGSTSTTDPVSDEAPWQVVVVGGGVAGLYAAWRLQRSGLVRVLLLEGAPEVGGTSVAGESLVSRFPWGAHYVPVPGPSQPELQELLVDMGAAQQTEEGFVPRESSLVIEPAERTFYQGQWHAGLFPFSGARSRKELGRFRREVDRWIRWRDPDGRRAFGLPFASGSDHSEVRRLDEMSFAEWLGRQDFTDSGFRWYVRYACRDDYGTEPEQLSAWYGLAYFAARCGESIDDPSPFVTWADGNGRVVRHLAETLRAVRTRAAVTKVTPRGDRPFCRVEYVDTRSGVRRAVHGQAVVVAMPSYLRPHVLPARLAGTYRPEYAPWLVANLELDGRPSAPGFETAWDNVIVDSESLGYVVATHQSGASFGPTVWTYYRPFSAFDAATERKRMGGASYREVSEAVYLDLDRVHVDLAPKVKRIDLMRWGHGMVRPTVGRAFDSGRRSAQAAQDGVHFAHTDLSGAALLEEAIFHGARAAREVLAEVRPS